MTSLAIQAFVTEDGLLLNGHLFSQDAPVQDYAVVIGVPDRTIDPAPPAPYGHRNNQIHVFDSFGVYLNEHHSSQLIEAVTFVFRNDMAPFKTNENFSGQLNVFGVDVQKQKSIKQYPAEWLSRFRRAYDGEYDVRLGRCWVGMSATGSVQGKRELVKLPHFVHVTVCF